MTKIKINREVLAKMIEDNPSFANEWCVAWSGFKQYADHVNGYRSIGGVVFKTLSGNGEKAGGFKTKGEWRRVLSSKTVKAITRKDPRGRYGCKAKSLKVSELLKVIDKGWDLCSSNCVFNLIAAAE